MKTTLTFTILCLSFLVSLSQSPTDSLLLQYHFDGDATDNSINGLDGVITGATLTEDRCGTANSAYHFDGIDDYIELPNDAKLKPDMPATIAFWINMESLDIQKSRFISTEYDYDNYSGFRIGGKDQVILQLCLATIPMGEEQVIEEQK